MAIEEEFELTIPDAVADTIERPQEAVDFIYGELSKDTDVSDV